MSVSSEQIRAVINQAIKDCTDWVNDGDGNSVRRISQATTDKIRTLALADGVIDYDEDVLIRAFVIGFYLKFENARPLLDALPDPGHAAPWVRDDIFIRDFGNKQNELRNFQLSYDLSRAEVDLQKTSTALSRLRRAHVPSSDSRLSTLRDHLAEEKSWLAQLERTAVAQSDLGAKVDPLLSRCDRLLSQAQ